MHATKVDDRSAGSRQQRMRAIDAELRRDIGAHAHRAAHHVDIETLDIERRKQELRSHVTFVEIGCVFPPHVEHALHIAVSLAVPVIRIAIDRIGGKRPPEGAMPVARRVSRIDRAVASAVPHQHVRKLIGGAMVETAAHLLDVVHPEEDIERAIDVGIEFGGAIAWLLAQREVERH